MDNALNTFINIEGLTTYIKNEVLQAASLITINNTTVTISNGSGASVSGNLNDISKNVHQLDVLNIIMTAPEAPEEQEMINTLYDNFYKIPNSNGSETFSLAMRIDPSFMLVNFVSDKRLKKQIHTLKNPLKKINSMRGVEWVWKSNNKRSTGLIAQELIKIDPDLVNDKNEFMSINYVALFGYVIEAFKEQTKIQKTQSKKINVLEKKLNTQQKEIDDLKSKMKLLLSKL